MDDSLGTIKLTEEHCLTFVGVYVEIGSHNGRNKRPMAAVEIRTYYLFSIEATENVGRLFRNFLSF